MSQPNATGSTSRLDEHLQRLTGRARYLLTPGEVEALGQIVPESFGTERVSSAIHGEGIIATSKFIVNDLSKLGVPQSGIRVGGPDGEMAVGSLVFSITLERIGRVLATRIEPSDSLGPFWTWLVEQPNVDIFVNATLEFPREEYDCIVPLPLEIPPSALGVFSEAPGITLTKRADGLASGPSLYDVVVRLVDEVLRLTVTYRSPVSGSPDLAARLVAHAREIAGFALRPATPPIA